MYRPTTWHLKDPHLSFISHLDARFIIYTYCSATVGALKCDAGMVVIEGDAANPTTHLTKRQRGATFTSSYDEKKAAMRMAHEWLSPSHATTTICTDSQSLLKAIQSGFADTVNLRSMFTKRAEKTTLL